MGPELDDPALEEVLAKFPSRKREIYSEGLVTTLDLKKHSICTGFIKAENVPLKPEDKPRVIQFRDPAFLAHMLSTMKPLEHAFYHNRYCFNTVQALTCAKGMDPLMRMEALLGIVRRLDQPTYIGLDGSAFDAHVSPGALKAEWKFYETALIAARYDPVSIRKLKAMGKCQLSNKVRFRTDDGFASYKVEGNRMSGDLNTGLGNSVLMSLFVTTLMMEWKIPDTDWGMLDDGDDCAVFVSMKYAHLFTTPAIRAFFANFSQDMKVEKVAIVSVDNMEPIEFCQASPVLVNGSWRLIRNPKKVYNGYKMQPVYYRSIDEAKRFWKTIASPELIYASGVPVLEEMFRMFHRLSGDAKPLDAVSRRFWLRQIDALPIEASLGVEPSTRASFAKAFGYTELQQLQMEQTFALWMPKDLPTAWEDD